MAQVSQGFRIYSQNGQLKIDVGDATIDQISAWL
jgi:hypothetical protein